MLYVSVLRNMNELMDMNEALVGFGFCWQWNLSMSSDWIPSFVPSFKSWDDRCAIAAEVAYFDTLLSQAYAVDLSFIMIYDLLWVLQRHQ